MKHFSYSKKQNAQTTGGFLIIELIVALFVFGIVMTVSIGSVIAVIDANKKAQSLESIMNNLNLAMDSMTKALAVGSTYNCLVGPIVTDCSTGPGDGVTFESQDGGTVQTIRFFFETPCVGGGTGGCIKRQIGSAPAFRMTAPEVNIQDAKFYVAGTQTLALGDTNQPRVSIFIKGQAGVNTRNPTDFSIQTMVSQRVPDL